MEAITAFIRQTIAVHHSGMEAAAAVTEAVALNICEKVQLTGLFFVFNKDPVKKEEEK